MTIASSYGWWTLSVSSSMNVMACSSIALVLGNHPESWTFCTTFRYVFLDLEDCPVKVPPMMTLISPSRGHDGSSNFPFNFSSLWSRPRKFLNFSCLMRFSICYFKPKHSSVSYSWSLWKQQYCSYSACWDLLSFSSATSKKDRPWFAWELVLAACSRACITDFVSKSLPSCYLNLSFLLSVPSLDKDPTQDGAGDLLPFTQLSSSS